MQELSLSKMFSNDDEDDGRMDEEIPDADGFSLLLTDSLALEYQTKHHER